MIFQQNVYPMIDYGREVSNHIQHVCINPLVSVDVYNEIVTG